MLSSLAELLLSGMISLPWWGYIVVTLILTQITIASVTIFLHRHQAHRALDLHPVASHFFRFWLWLTTGMITKEWVAVHRKHHAKVETPDDPHSPLMVGIRKVLWQGVELYQEEADDKETVSSYGHGTPEDWFERMVYGRDNWVGVKVMLGINVLLFGALGVSIWAIQMLWIPFWAAGVINGIGHWWGYRNYESRDISRNIFPIAMWIGGEELHNNHHAFPSSARFSSKWWEFDLGWTYIRILEIFGLASVKKVAPQPVVMRKKNIVDMDTLRAVVVSRLHVMAHYGRDVIIPVLRDELHRADDSCRRMLKQARRSLLKEPAFMDEVNRGRLDKALAHSQILRTVYQYRQQLQEVWGRSASSHEHLLQRLQNWCNQAEATGIGVLQEFAGHLRGYALKDQVGLRPAV